MALLGYIIPFSGSFQKFCREVHMVRANLENMNTMLIRIEDIGQSLLSTINNIGWTIT